MPNTDNLRTILTDMEQKTEGGETLLEARALSTVFNLMLVMLDRIEALEQSNNSLRSQNPIIYADGKIHN